MPTLLFLAESLLGSGQRDGEIALLKAGHAAVEEAAAVAFQWRRHAGAWWSR